MGFIPYIWQFAKIADRSFNDISVILKNRDIIPIENNIDRGYVAIGEKNVIISFQGSKEFKDWLSDFDVYPLKGAMKSAYDIIKEGRNPQDILHHSGILKEGKWGRGTIHDGLYSAWNGCKEGINSALKMIPIDKPIIFSGHSRGGAISELASRHTKKNLGFKDVSFAGFGNPRVGIRPYRDEYNKLGIYATNIRNGIDMVPRLPYRVMGFRHIGNSICIKYGFFHNINRTNKFKDHYGWAYTRGIEKEWGPLINS